MSGALRDDEKEKPRFVGSLHSNSCDAAFER
jgi:hypothetical protein